MALEPGYTYTTSIATGSSSVFDVKNSTSAPLVDLSKNITANGSLTALPKEQCQQIKLIPSSSNIYISINSGSIMQLSPGIQLTINTQNSNNIRISGSGDCPYILSR